MGAAEIDALIASSEAMLQRRERFAMITDGSAVRGIPGPVERRRLTDWLARAEVNEALRKYSLGSSTIVASPLARGALQAIYWLWTAPNPQHAARDLDDAWKWVVARFAEAGEALPGGADALRASLDRELARR